MKLFPLLLVILLGVIQCNAAPQMPDAAAAPGPDEKPDLEEAIMMLEYLRDEVKMDIEIIIQQKLFNVKTLLEETVQDTMNAVLDLRGKILERIKKIRAKEIKINEKLKLKQEKFLVDLRMDVMEILLLLVEPDANTLGALENVGKKLLEIRAKIVDKVMMLIMLKDGGIVPDGEIDCEPFKALDDSLDPEKLVDTKTGEALLTLLSDHLMTVDEAIKKKYLGILAQTDEKKRMDLQDGLQKLKEISGCLNDVMLPLSMKNEEDEDKIKRIIERDVGQCHNMVRRQLKACESANPSVADCTCGADEIDKIVKKLEDWEKIITDENDSDTKKEEIRDEAIAFLAKLDMEMTVVLKEKIEGTNTEPKDVTCQNDKLEVFKANKMPMWMMVNITIFGEDAVVEEMISALIKAQTEMRSKYCTEEERRTDSDDTCVVEEIATAKEWTADIDALIKDKLFKPETEGKDVMLEIVTIKETMEKRVIKLFQNGLECNAEVDQIKFMYSEQINKCLMEIMDKGEKFMTQQRHVKVDCMKKLRTMIEERRGMLWMQELMKKIQERESAGSGDNPADG